LRFHFLQLSKSILSSEPLSPKLVFYSSMGRNFTLTPNMEYNTDVEEFQDIEYPMLQGKTSSSSSKPPLT
jgi:hypothetical protein